MSKCFFLALTLLLIISCKKSEDKQESSFNLSAQGPTESVIDSPVETASPDENTLEVKDEPTAPPAEAPVVKELLGANITMVNFTPEQEEKYKKAIDLVKKVVSTQAFKDQVINHTYKGSKTYVDNRGLSNAQIYRKILDAAETLQPAKNKMMDLEVELYYAATTTVGYTYASSKRIWVNTKYFNKYGIPSVANNLFHEWLHKLGFGHASTYSTSRDYSVPYAIGDIIEGIGKSLPK